MMKANPIRRAIIGARDRDILNFLWRWKLVSTAALGVRFFNSSAQAAYKRLNTLE